MKLLLSISALSLTFWEKMTEFFTPELGAYDNFSFNIAIRGCEHVRSTTIREEDFAIVDNFT